MYPFDECEVNFMFGVARKSLHVAAVQEIAMTLYNRLGTSAPKHHDQYMQGPWKISTVAEGATLLK